MGEAQHTDRKLIEMTVPEKPNRRLQKYRLTELGKAKLAALRKPEPVP